MAPFIAVALTYLGSLMLLVFISDFGLHVGVLGVLAIVPVVIIIAIIRLLSNVEKRVDPPRGEHE